MTIGFQVLITALAFLQSPAGTQSHPMTLDEALAIAENNAFPIRIQATQVEKSRVHVSEARAGLGPKISGTGTYTRYPTAITTKFSASSPPIVIQPIDTKVISYSLLMPLDILGDLRRQVTIALEQYQAQKQTFQASKNDTRLNVRTAYFNVLRAIAQVGVAQAGQTDAQERLTQGQQQFSAAQLAKVDVESFGAQLEQARSNLVNAQNSLELADEQFNQVLARPIETPVNLVDPTTLPASPTDARALVVAAQAQRPEILALKKNVEALSNVVKANESGLHPTLGVSLSQQRLIGTGGFSSSSVTTLGQLTLSVPVFDSGLTRDRVRESRQDVEQARITLEQQELGISTEVRAALANLGSAKARLENAQTQVSHANEVYRLAKVRQSAGVATYVEVIDAENSLTQARSNLVTAKYDYLTSFSQLQRAVGTDNLGGLAPPSAASATGGK